MSLADERRAIASGIAAARQSQQMVGDLQSLESQRRRIGTLNELERRGTLAAKVGRATYKAPAAGTGGIASPLTEQTKTEDGQQVPDRAYYDELVIPSSDGIFTFSLAPIKSTKFTDANNSLEVRNWAKPKASGS